MINIVAGLGENENIIKASNELKDIEDLNITLVRSEDELLEAFKNPEVHATLRGSLKASKIIKSIKELKPDCKINRTTYINTSDDEGFSKDYEFLLAPVGIDEGKNIEEKVELAIQAANFLQYLGKMPKIAILAEGRKDDLGRSERIDESLLSSQKLTYVLIETFKELDNFDNGSKDISKNYSIKNYYILLEQAIEDGYNIILANDGIFGNIMFRTLGYVRSLKLAYKLAKLKE